MEIPTNLLYFASILNHATLNFKESLHLCIKKRKMVTAENSLTEVSYTKFQMKQRIKVLQLCWLRLPSQLVRTNNPSISNRKCTLQLSKP